MEKENINSGFSASDFEHGWLAKWEEKLKRCQPPAPIGVWRPRILPAQQLCHPCCQGLAWSFHEAGVPALVLRNARLGRNRRAQMCETCTFSKEEKRDQLGFGLALGKELLPCLCRQHPPPGYGLLKPFPHRESREPREGGRKLPDPIKGRRRLTLRWEISAWVNTGTKPNVYVHLLLKCVGDGHCKG